MRTLISTAEVPSGQGFQRWREALADRMLPVKLAKVDECPFVGKLEAANVGSLRITRVTQSAVRIESDQARHNHDDETLAVGIMLSGTRSVELEGRSSTQAQGDLVVMSRRPATMVLLPDTVSRSTTRSLIVGVPRQRLERLLGSERNYVGITVGIRQPGAPIVINYFKELVRVCAKLDKFSAERLSSIGVDLLAASIAERLGQEVPKSLRGSVVLQRAKAYIEENLTDPTLDPPQLAAAMGVSLRFLQQLFQENGCHISELIWQRRLEFAAIRLADSRCQNILIGLIAYNCGFSSQAHFSRRFKDRYGISPSDYRHAPGKAYSAVTRS